ncbi:uncharacterized protein Z520_05391 [Fonsecaea multimorphosa CBS 102226]|uniref:Myb-like domain-containing protein n=1 Tax=Fonsecaea multimorphosa CBS 102226 TaxID=1442371 RepID=A0A0D2HAN7_9EURO|nr:uncharacterized protein Z520_05391 [Fonsecaea multimorphosa CBS 102226]KIX98930.1 hypothetical protein Z520_05391 [Fonsecaea multimorphosa CBS 102226]OAL25203.1 hypothetical protein AYO22_05080 [Fonsecaea multimorphosa]
MVTSMPPTMTPWNPPQMHSLHYADHSLQYGQQQMMSNYLQSVPNSMPPVPHLQRETIPRPGQSGPWNAEEDNILLDAKGRGLSWEEIHRRYFPNKSANACRKRHERVLAKMRDTDWDEARIQRVTDAYNRHRHSIWQPLCKELGESMSDVEKVMFQQGLRNLRNPSRSSHARNRSRASSGQGVSDYERGSSLDEEYGHTDDSGISLGNTAHSRRASEITSGLSTESLPSVNRLLSETVGYGYTA